MEDDQAAEVLQAVRGPSSLAIRDFSAGLIETGGGIAVPLGGAQSLQNVLPIGQGGLKRREPTVTFVSPVAQDVRRVFRSQALPGFLLVGGTNLYTVAGASIGAHGLTNPDTANMVTAVTSGGQGPVYMQDIFGSTPKYATGGTLGTWTASAGTLPLGVDLAWHGNRMWVAGHTGLPRRLFFSEINDPRVWSGGTSGFVDLPESMTALCRCGPYLLVFTETGTYVVYDLNTGAYRKISDVGTPNGTTVVEGRQGNAYFLTLDNAPRIVRTDGNGITAVGRGLAPWADNPRLTYEGGCLLAVTAGSTTIHVYIEEFDSWWKLVVAGGLTTSNWRAGNSGISYGAGGSEATFIVSGTGGSTQALNIQVVSETPTAGADADGSAISTHWWGGDLDFGVPELRKRVRSMDIEGAALAAAGLTKDCSNSAPTTTALTFGPSGSTVKSARLNNPGVARYWAPYLSDSANAWTVRAITLNAQARKN